VRFSTRGVQKHHKKLFGKNTCQKLLAEKVENYFFSPFRLYPALLCVSQQGEFKNTTKHFLGEIHVKNFWPKKLRGKNFFPFVFSHRFFFIAFLALSLHEEPKNTIKIFSQIRPENLKNLKKGR
jgi:hypothetical protein